MKITALTVDSLTEGCVTDEPPLIGFSLESDQLGESLATAHITVGDWGVETQDQIANRYAGSMEPFTEYAVSVVAHGTSGAVARAETSFRTGRLNTPWTAHWITDAGYITPGKQSPVPMTFRTSFAMRGGMVRAWLESTALGVYELEVNGAKVGEDYFAPGFTSYGHHIQYQTYEVHELLAAENTISATVAGGWAVGSFTHQRKNKIYADRQALLLELHIQYDDGSFDVVGTGPDWEVSTNGPFVMAEWYDGETFDARISPDQQNWKPADITAPKGVPHLLAQYGAPVRAHQEIHPVSQTVSPTGELIYDLGQNFAGVISAAIRGAEGQTVTFRHAEVLVDGELFVKSLRTAKATATYTCIEGEQTYSPKLTYMGFRYVGVRGIDPDDLQLTGLVLHSDLPEGGTFSSSDPRINALQSAILWGGRSNLMDIPTDCPQRDEREGWTGDYAVFATTASYNFDMSRFLRKWMRDLTAEQGRGGGIPMVVPKAGNGFPTMATSCWGDVCVLAPWAEYLARGDLSALRRDYPTMKKFLKAARWWSSFLAVGTDQRHIWRWPFHFGDWTSPDGSVRDWLRKGKWVGTAYFANSCGIVAQIADLLGEQSEADYYRQLRAATIRAYRDVFTDRAGTLKNEFQTAYVLPLHFDMTSGAETEAMVGNLERLIEEAGGHLATGFPGTPYILFALSDNGRPDAAYRLLLQTTSPSWLYMVDSGGTTIWERWDALRPDGTVNITDLASGKSDEESSGGMVSFNHYAAGAVGDWLYRRVAGIEPLEGGYRTFRVAPVIGGGLTSADGSVTTPYGRASSSWVLDDNQFTLRVQVPVSTTCLVTLPDGTAARLESGRHELSCALAVAE